jgi:hypothetical protein
MVVRSHHGSHVFLHARDLVGYYSPPASSASRRSNRARRTKIPVRDLASVDEPSLDYILRLDQAVGDKRP